MTRLHELTQTGVFDLHIICRLSTQEAADGESLEAQVTQAKHDAAIILETSEADIVFVDGFGSRPSGTNGKRVVKVSACHISGGTDWEDRQDLQEVLNDARAGRCRAVQTPNLDRVARNVEVAERFRRELLAYGVRTLYEGRTTYDLADDNQQLLYGMRAQFSAWERRTITKRNFSGRLRAVREGFSLGGNVPFGTRLEPTGLRSKNRHFRVVVDEAEMRIVRELFERRCAGETPRQLAAWTRSIGVQPNADHYLSTGPGLRANHIYVILRNDFYVTGRLAFTVSAPRWPSEVIEQQIHLPAPIPQSLFNEVAGLHERRRGTRLPKGTYLLSGLVYHRESGTPFQSRPTAGRWFYYRNEEWGRSRRKLYAARKLSRAALTPPGGNQPVFASIPKALLERMVIGEVMKLLGDEHLIDQLIAADEERRASGHSALHDGYYKKQAEINDAEAGLERFLDAFASGVLMLSTATTRKQHQLEDRITRLGAEAAVLRDQLEQVEPRPERIGRLKAALAELPEILENAPPAQQFAAFRAIVNRVWVNNSNEITLELALG